MGMDRNLSSFNGHTPTPVRAVGISPDGKYVVSGSSRKGIEPGDELIKIWELSTGKLLRTLEGRNLFWKCN